MGLIENQDHQKGKIRLNYPKFLSWTRIKTTSNNDHQGSHPIGDFYVETGFKPVSTVQICENLCPNAFF